MDTHACTLRGFWGVLGKSSLYYGYSVEKDVGEATEGTALQKKLGWSQALKNDLEYSAKKVK